MEIQKPEVSENMKKLCNRVFTYMWNYEGYHTKEELCAVLGWDYPQKDRQIREVISILARMKPIISTSDSRGYKLAKTEKDKEEARHQENELIKRANEIMARVAPLRNFIGG